MTPDTPQLVSQPKPMKQLQRLLFLQGNKCFFCAHRIPDGQASVEHLEPLSKGGKKTDDNSVACCETVNKWLSDQPVKEKLRVLLSHKGVFACPAVTVTEPVAKPQDKSIIEAQKLLPDVVKNLDKCGKTKPKSPSALKNRVTTSFPKASPKVVEAILVLLKQKNY